MFMVLIVICLLIEKKSFSFKLTIKKLHFQLSFVLEAYLMDLESREVSLSLVDF